VVIAQLDRAINHALRYSLAWPEYAARLNHSLIRCDIPLLNMQIYARIENEQITLNRYGPESVDLVISATPSALLEMAQTKKAGSKISISGNAALAQTLQQAISALDIDWEGVLADQIGEMPARQASQLFTRVKTAATRFATQFLADSADYWVDEQRLLASQTEVEPFYQEVTTLRYEVDRLEARIRRLEGN
jgi:ubiquinone biosynthesis protein UbiJ